ncbi:diglucosylglycerate octanoyltransferase [Actinoalloteichus fjordicus]|uniref:diglucosylglycerate octanoyltransferase n=1 Tax=Actinoalloteichus TaxID=65496 RepID=UPI0009FA076C|nr:diglucosylglycerate octanoyltransferase [Actinoalloteichus fjordicus]
MDSARGTLLVLGDSLTFHGPRGPHPADEPGLWPNVASARLGTRAELVAGLGWTARDAWWALTRDPRCWAALPHARAVVLAVGSMDTLPSPLPTVLREGMRYLRPDGLRRRVRAGYRRLQPGLARMLGGRPVALPPRLTVRYLEDCRAAVTALRPDVTVIGMLPSVHRAAEYAGVHTGHAPAVAAVRTWGSRTDTPLLDLPALVTAHLAAGLGNPDGMHWGWQAHQDVGVAVAELLLAGAACDSADGPAAEQAADEATGVDPDHDDRQMPATRVTR